MVGKEAASVAVVDDDRGIRDAVSSLLRSAGFLALLFDSAEALLASGCLNKARCLIADIELPGMSGIDLNRELKNSGSSIPVILISGHDHRRKIARRTGAVAVLGKPFDGDELLDAVRSALERSE